MLVIDAGNHLGGKPEAGPAGGGKNSHAKP